MQFKSYPVIDPIATGENIVRLRKERGMSVKQMQGFFGFEEPQAIYQWQWGKSLPSVDNLYALSTLFEVPMDSIIVPYPSLVKTEQQEKSCCSVFYLMLPVRADTTSLEAASALNMITFGFKALPELL